MQIVLLAPPPLINFYFRRFQMFDFGLICQIWVSVKRSVFFSCTNVALILLMLKVKEKVNEVNDTMQVLVKMQQSQFTSTEEFLTTSAVEQFFTRRVYFSLEPCKCIDNIGPAYFNWKIRIYKFPVGNCNWNGP